MENNNKNEIIELPAPVVLDGQDEVEADIPNQMLVKRIVKNGSGGLDAVISLDPFQTHFLINFALTFLIANGAAKVVDTEEPTEEDDDTTIIDQPPTE